MSLQPNVTFLDRETCPPPFDWPYFVDALRQGHARPRPELRDVFLGPPEETFLSRSAWIEGLGYGVKSVTVVPKNAAAGRPTVQGGMLIFAAGTGDLRGIIDSRLITDIKTAADSVLGAQLLARPDAQCHLIIGSGTVARNIASAYHTCLPQMVERLIWSRSFDNATGLAHQLHSNGIPARATADLPAACEQADVISTATLSHRPVLAGEWVRPGTHVDLIGAYRKDMREADDVLLRKGLIYVDCFDTTVDHIGELVIPLEEGAITRQSILADFYQLAHEGGIDRKQRDITVFKNGGGAHLDLMIADALLSRFA